MIEIVQHKRKSISAKTNEHAFGRVGSVRAAKLCGHHILYLLGAGLKRPLHDSVLQKRDLSFRESHDCAYTQRASDLNVPRLRAGFVAPTRGRPSVVRISCSGILGASVGGNGVGMSFLVDAIYTTTMTV